MLALRVYDYLFICDFSLVWCGESLTEIRERGDRGICGAFGLGHVVVVFEY